MRKIIFVLSILLHLLLFQWLLHYKINLNITYEDQVTTVKLIPPGKLFLPGPPEPPPVSLSSRKSPPGGKEPEGSTVLTIPETSAAPPQALPIEELETETVTTETPPPDSKLKAPSTDAPLAPLPDLSLSSKDMKQFLTNFNRKQAEARARMRATTAGAVGGPGGGQGTGTGGQGYASLNIDSARLKPWAKRALLSIQNNWTIPPAVRQNPRSLVEIAVTIERNGDISAVKVNKSTYEQTLDQAAVNAIRMSSPLPRLPETFPFKNLQVSLKFNYDWK